MAGRPLSVSSLDRSRLPAAYSTCHGDAMSIHSVEDGRREVLRFGARGRFMMPPSRRPFRLRRRIWISFLLFSFLRLTALFLVVCRIDYVIEHHIEKQQTFNTVWILAFSILLGAKMSVLRWLYLMPWLFKIFETSLSSTSGTPVEKKPLRSNRITSLGEISLTVIKKKSTKAFEFGL